MTPYYDEDGITIYHGDCREIVPQIATHDVTLVLTDPPYGINIVGTDGHIGSGKLYSVGSYAPVRGDDEPFDPTPWLTFPKSILFGANHYADRLPPSAGWLVWDKDLGLNNNNFSDAELAWTNVTGGVRVFRHLWKGMLKDSERDQRRVHPTQKPVALMRWCIGVSGVDKGIVLDPYMGSGPVGVAAHERGLRYVGIEIEERYCEIAVQRLAQGVLAFD